MLKKTRLKNYVSYSISIICAFVSLICFCLRVPYGFKNYKSAIKVFTAGFMLPDGMIRMKQNNELITESNKVTNFERYKKYHESNVSNASCKDNDKEIDDEYHAPDEKTFKITESQFRDSGIAYENFYVKNKTSFNLNIADELSKPPDIKIKKDNSPQVLIVHTHTSESYMKKDLGFYYESFYPRSTYSSKNIIQVGNAIENKLKKSKIGVIHDCTYHDNPTYNGSYSRSAKTIRKNLEQYSSINVVLDIHRDAIGNNETGKIKPTFKVNGKKAAQIMIISGCDLDGSMGFTDWEYNLRFALRLQKTAETMYPGMTRALNFANVKYNMDITHGSLLIEVGSDANTLDEAVYTGELLGDVLVSVLNELL